MSEQPPSVNRRFFGMRRSAVTQMVSDRDVMLRQAEGRVRAAEAKVARLESDVAALQEANARLREETETNRGGGDGGAPDITTRFLNEELGTILTAAEESAGRIVDRARASTQQQVAEAERVWREAQTQVSKFAAWRDEVDPALRTAQAKIDEVRARIEQVPDQIREALAPLAESVASLDGDLAEVSRAGGPPVLSPPPDHEPADHETAPVAPADQEEAVEEAVQDAGTPHLEAEPADAEADGQDGEHATAEH